VINVKIDIPRGTRLLPKYLPPDCDLTEWAESGFNTGQLAFLQRRKWNFFLDLEPGEISTYIETTVQHQDELLIASILFGKVTIIDD
jgi:hypothetical protein